MVSQKDYRLKQLITRLLTAWREYRKPKEAENRVKLLYDYWPKGDLVNGPWIKGERK